MTALQQIYTPNMEIALPGVITDNVKSSTFLNAAGDTYQVETIEIGTPANSTDYTLTKVDPFGNSCVITYTSDGSATATEIRDGLIAAFKANYNLFASFYTTVVDSDTFTITDRKVGRTTAVGVVSGGSTGYAVSITTSATASTYIAPGRIVATKSSYGAIDGIRLAALPTSAGTAQVETIVAGTATNSTAYNIIKDGVTVTYTSDGSATAAEIVAGLVAAFNGSGLFVNYVASANGTTGVFITDKVIGRTSSAATVSGGGSGYVTSGITTAATAADAPLGIVTRSHIYPQTGFTDTTVAYAIRNQLPLTVVEIGAGYVESEAALAVGDTVYWRQATSGGFTNTGVISGTSGTGKATLVGASVEEASAVLQDGTIITRISYVKQ